MKRFNKAFAQTYTGRAGGAARTDIGVPCECAYDYPVWELCTGRICAFGMKHTTLAEITYYQSDLDRPAICDTGDAVKAENDGEILLSIPKYDKRMEGRRHPAPHRRISLLKARAPLIGLYEGSIIFFMRL